MARQRSSAALNLVEIARRFPDDAKARAFLESIRWPDGPVCPHCAGVNNAHKIPENAKAKVRPGLYLCRDKACAKQFTVTVGTVFESSKVGLSNWLIAWHLMCASKKGIAALELQRLLGIGSYRTAWFMCMRIRESLKSGSFDGSPLRGIVEADATYVGGKSRRGSKSRYKSKVAVLAMVERDGRAVATVIDGETRAEVEPVLAAAIDPSATLMTDEAHAYRAPGKAFAGHETVAHTDGEYARGAGPNAAHTGTVDAFHGLVKRGHYGVWHKMSRKYTERYVDEFAYRFSNRRITDGARTVKALGLMSGKRLRLVDLRQAA